MNQTERLAQEGTGMQGEQTFKNKLNQLQKVLSVNELDFRVGRTGVKGDMAWGTLLAYKDSRVDMKRLDDVFGGEWSNTYKRDSKGVLQCEISIYNRDLNQWVSRSSNGVPSNFEGEKGEYSDALKRAGFVWGVGRELYDFPDMFFKFLDSEFWVQDAESKKPKVNPTYKFKPNDWDWKVDWDHVDQHGNKGLVHAKGKGSSSYRVKPTSIIQKHKL